MNGTPCTELMDTLGQRFKPGRQQRAEPEACILLELCNWPPDGASKGISEIGFSHLQDPRAYSSFFSNSKIYNSKVKLSEP